MTDQIHVFDNVMDPFSHQKTWEFLKGPGWSFGAYSDEHPDAPRYWYKHFAGYSANAAEDAANVRHTLKDQPPRGTHWAVSSGCGTRIEGVTDNVAFGCGMGHVPAKSRRFLYFFSRT